MLFCRFCSSRGSNYIEVHIVPSDFETSLWDNSKFASIEVLADTIGVLHIAGAPSWDVRFMRRGLKSEPKFDVVSFFILRDQKCSKC